MNWKNEKKSTVAVFADLWYLFSYNDYHVSFVRKYWIFHYISLLHSTNSASPFRYAHFDTLAIFIKAYMRIFVLLCLSHFENVYVAWQRRRLNQTNGNDSLEWCGASSIRAKNLEKKKIIQIQQMTQSIVVLNGASISIDRRKIFTSIV